MKTWIASAILTLVTLGVHWPFERAEFSYDDRAFVESNPAVQSLGAAIAAFGLPFPPGDPDRGLYRPLTGLSYAFDHASAGLDARAFHRTNTLLYAAAVLAALALLRVQRLPLGVAFAAALLFAVHPVHCDAVDSIAGRSELLAFLFGLLALIAWLMGLRRAGIGLPLVSAGAYALACLSKETGVTWIAVLALAGVAQHGLRDAGGWRRHAPLALHAGVALGYLALRIAVLGRFSPDHAILRDAGLLARVSTMGAVFWLDLRQLVWPAVLEVDFYYQQLLGVLETPSTATLFGWAGMGALGVLGLRAARDQLRDPQPTGAARVTAFAIFFATLFPTSHLLDIGALFAERFLFSASLGIVTLAVLAGNGALTRKTPPRARTIVGAALTAALATAGAVHARDRAFVWRDSVQLWQATAGHIEDARVLVNLAAAQLERGDTGGARSSLTRARVLAPDSADVHGNLGVLHLERGEFPEAERAFRRALEIAPRQPMTWYNLGRVALARDDHAAARSHFARALEIAPGFPPAQAALTAMAAAP